MHNVDLALDMLHRLEGARRLNWTQVVAEDCGLCVVDA